MLALAPHWQGWAAVVVTADLAARQDVWSGWRKATIARHAVRRGMAVRVMVPTTTHADPRLTTSVERMGQTGYVIKAERVADVIMDADGEIEFIPFGAEGRNGELLITMEAIDRRQPPALVPRRIAAPWRHALGAYAKQLLDTRDSHRAATSIQVRRLGTCLPALAALTVVAATVTATTASTIAATAATGTVTATTALP